MESKAIYQNAKKDYIQLTTLLMLAFCSVFFPRVLLLLKFPSAINLAHLGIVPWACGLILFKTKAKDSSQIKLSQDLFLALLLLLTVMFASALLNSAGFINVVVDFILLAEPFIFLLALISIPMSLASLTRFRNLIIYSGFINTLFAFVQSYVLHLERLPGIEDNIKGVFIFQGAGHVIGASVALTFGLYYFFQVKTMPIWIRAGVFLTTFWHMKLSDAKQVLAVLLLAGLLLLLTKFKNIVEALKFMIGGALIVTILWWCIQNLEAFEAFKTWNRPELYGLDGEATKLKFATFSIVPTYYHSFLHPWLGLGPGHTVGRLGGWMLREYGDLLTPLGSTTHPASNQVWYAVGASWLGDQSSLFSPLFGWAGIWGDLGFLGLGVYLYLWFLVWFRICPDEFSRYLILSVFCFGIVFSQLEEPAYMLFVVSLIGLQWQEKRLSISDRQILKEQ